MSTILSTQDRVRPLVLDTRVESIRNPFSALVEVIGEIGYCLKLSAQSLRFGMSGPASTYPASSAARLDSWPVDLWVF